MAIPLPGAPLASVAAYIMGDDTTAKERLAMLTFFIVLTRDAFGPSKRTEGGAVDSAAGCFVAGGSVDIHRVWHEDMGDASRRPHGRSARVLSRPREAKRAIIGDALC